MAAAKKKTVEAEVKTEEAVAPKKAPAKKTTKKAAEKKVEKRFAKATFRDYEVILKPVITEKSMALMQTLNQVTVKVKEDSNKAEVKLAFERIFQVKVVDVRISNVKAKLTTRGSRYKGVISGYKKAVVTIAEGEALDLFKE
ncbi:MAG: 50S ribosomal protein L23 [Erysipelotrichaceae bacterium]|jgi:large subunit ribosomal protein L23|nr:50S ribosomal protein L23 [Erysipelotrichaceae bacterium]